MVVQGSGADPTRTPPFWLLPKVLSIDVAIHHWNYRMTYLILSNLAPGDSQSCPAAYKSP